MINLGRVLAPTVAVSCWFGQVAMVRFWGGDAKQATTQTVASAAPRLADTSGRREIAPLKSLGVESSTPTYPKYSKFNLQIPNVKKVSLSPPFHLKNRYLKL